MRIGTHSFRATEGQRKVERETQSENPSALCIVSSASTTTTIHNNNNNNNNNNYDHSINTGTCVGFVPDTGSILFKGRELENECPVTLQLQTAIKAIPFDP